MTFATAAAATIAAGSCRFRLTTTYEPPEEKDLTRVTAGDADLARWRARGRTDHGAWLDDLAKQLAERWPWLDDDEEAEDPISVWIGGAQFYGRVDLGGDRTGPPDPSHPLWILTSPSDRNGERVEVVDWSTTIEGRLTRVEWLTHPRSRPRARYQPRRRPRDVLELWDHGLTVDIPIPDADPPGRLRDVIALIPRLRRTKRDWEAKQR